MAKNYPLKDRGLPKDFSIITFIPPKAGQTATAGTVIGTAKCRACGAENYIRVDAGRHVYGYCNHHHPNNVEPCNATIAKWGRDHSNPIIAHWASLSEKKADVTPQPLERNDRPTVAAPVAKPAVAKPAAVRKPEQRPTPERDSGERESIGTLFGG